MDNVQLMMLGAIIMACFCAALFFLRFWKTTRDRFFLFFSAAFFIEGINRILQGIMRSRDEQDPIIYFIRLVAFLIILYAIIDKNLVRKNTLSKGTGTPPLPLQDR